MPASTICATRASPELSLSGLNSVVAVVGPRGAWFGPRSTLCAERRWATATAALKDCCSCRHHERSSLSLWRRALLASPPASPRAAITRGSRPLSSGQTHRKDHLRLVLLLVVVVTLLVVLLSLSVSVSLSPCGVVCCVLCVVCCCVVVSLSCCVVVLCCCLYGYIIVVIVVSDDGLRACHDRPIGTVLVPSHLGATLPATPAPPALDDQHRLVNEGI